MIYLLDFIALVLAADAVTTAWFYGSIFENYRKTMEQKEGWVGELAGCLMCLSYHISIGLALILWFTIQVLTIIVNSSSGPWSQVFEVCEYLIRVPLYGLAATDLVHWLQQQRPIPVEEENDKSTS